MRDLISDLKGSLTGMKELYIERWAEKLKIWSVGSIEAYKGSQYSLNKEQLKVYKKNVMRYQVRAKEIEWFEAFREKVINLIGYTEILEARDKHYRYKTVEREHVSKFLHKLHKYKVIDENLSKPSEGLSKAQTAILYKEVRQLMEKIK
jgi:hypothetical protein